jgi:hypothetical protein
MSVKIFMEEESGECSWRQNVEKHAKTLTEACPDRASRRHWHWQLQA